MSKLRVNGVELYYELHGLADKPLLVLNNGIIMNAASSWMIPDGNTDPGITACCSTIAAGRDSRNTRRLTIRWKSMLMTWQHCCLHWG